MGEKIKKYDFYTGKKKKNNQQALSLRNPGIGLERTLNLEKNLKSAILNMFKDLKETISKEQKKV